MRDAAEFVRQPELFAPPPPFTPWDYIKLRREAAGLTIDRLADRIGGRPEHRSELIENLHGFEARGVRLKHVEWYSFHRHFPFDREVYRQLAECPPDQHPRLCRGCGWDRWTEQTDLDGADCTWSAEQPHLCTRCEQIDARGLRRAA